jgi:hypothetical protein
MNRNPQQVVINQAQQEEENKFFSNMKNLHIDKFVRKTSHEWYSTLPYKRMVDPDGWRDIMPVSKQYVYWFTVPISWDEFIDRHDSSSVTNNISQAWYPYGNDPTCITRMDTAKVDERLA